jgi:hypothetical protein
VPAGSRPDANTDGGNVLLTEERRRTMLDPRHHVQIEFCVP